MTQKKFNFDEVREKIWGVKKPPHRLTDEEQLATRIRQARDWLDKNFDGLSEEKQVEAVARYEKLIDEMREKYNRNYMDSFGDA